MERPDDATPAARPLPRLRALLASEYAVVLGVIVLGVAAVLVLMHSAGPSGVAAILRGTHP